MKKTTNLTATALGVALAAGANFATPETAQAEVAYNIGIHSKYLLRGIFEENSGAAVQGGVDWSNDSGWYAGYWFSSLSFLTTVLVLHQQIQLMFITKMVLKTTCMRAIPAASVASVTMSA